MAEAYLEVHEPKGERKVPLDEGPLTIGRNFTNLLVIDETQASRFHCVLEMTPDGFSVRDLDSRNGIKVNGKTVRAAVLGNGDIISIGKTDMKLVIPGAVRDVNPEDIMSQLAELVNETGSVETYEEPAAKEAPAAVVAAANEYERALRERAESLADRSFGENDITLINARGKVAHSGGRDGGGRDAGSRDGGDAGVMMRLILLICFRSRATDIHIEPKTAETHLRIRIDGAMVDLIRITKELGIKLLSMVKILCDIDIAHRNIVQEGHFGARVPGRVTNVGASERRVDYRVSFVPSVQGQKLVIRILDAANAPLHIADLNLPTRALEIIRETSQQESGMVLVCGPTGSGKTTTLYAILRDIDVTQRNVVTIEDPVEIQLEGVTQLPVNEAQGNSFSNLLRSILRQDPDVILVGEIRDAETARVAVQAGMTGHLVFSTIHSRDAISGMFRLLDLGVEPYVVASGLHLIVAQRLVRQLCSYCKAAVAPTPEQLNKFATVGLSGVKKIYKPKGCRRCLGTGYMGRRAVFECLVSTPALREAMLKNPTADECRRTLDPNTFVTLAQSGYRLVADGNASFEEVDRSII